MRIDSYLPLHGFTESRTRAKNLIELGAVSVNGTTVTKASFDVEEGAEISVSEDYGASLGGIKLRGALERCRLSCEKKQCLDIGSSNGGFCDVLLEKGAAKVIALDVGECALPERLLRDERILVKDRTNARFLTPNDLPYLPELVTVDVSFIPLSLVLPAVFGCLKEGGQVLALVKPQFECGKKALTKTGIVRSRKEEEKAVSAVSDTAKSLGFKVISSFPAPHPFENKNQEYFIFLSK